jgi:glycosyltransferase involved in cell wall biosynthesis
MKIAIVGIQGVPNNYGGFETLAEYLIKYLSADFNITVYCSSTDIAIKCKTWNDANLQYIPFSSHGTHGVIYDSISLIHACFHNDRILFLGFGGGFVIPILSRFKNKIILNFGGLDWKRDKWSPFAKRMIKKAEHNLMMNSSVVIADNIGIQNYIRDEYQIDAPLIAYGGDQATYRPITSELQNIYPFLGEKYACAVARIQPDNNVVMILDAFLEVSVMPVVFIGNWNSSDFGISIREKYSNNDNIILLDAIYDRNILDVLRSNCAVYIHGHSAGGTNPSLCEAMYLGLPIISFASGYNEYTTANKALYFNNSTELKYLLENYNNIDLKSIGIELKIIAEEHYNWNLIAEKYKKIFTSLV